jgi:hypothetical protein
LAGGSGNGNNNNGTSGAASQSSYGCLRKVVKRGPPYDFSVDRRCVWKFCLFEQFSDNNIKLSVKDRAAKKVMETATMAMKLSQLNREGAHTHIQNHTYGEDLPPLKSGTIFIRHCARRLSSLFDAVCGSMTYFLGPLSSTAWCVWF